jgi:phosphate:Na+ symporter
MPGHLIVLNLLGGVALLLWGTQMVQSGILRGFGAELRLAIARVAGRPLAAAATGTATAIALQSATATAMLAASFVARGMIALPAALALMLGADLGTTFVVQALSFDLGALMPLLLIAGILTQRLAGTGRGGQAGRILIGFGLILLALKLIVAASDPLRTSDLTAQILSRLSSDAILALGLAALLTWLMHSSVAFVLFVATLGASGIVDPRLALILVLGANLGAGLIPLGLAFRSAVPSRRMLAGNLAFRAIGVLAVTPFAGSLADAFARSGADPARLAAHFHTLFNLGLVLVFLPLTGLAARLLTAAIRDRRPDAEAAQLDHLDPSLLDQPVLALNAATRALMQLADKVELMLREAILTFEETDSRRINAVAALEEEVDDAQEAIKLYLARLMQRELTAAETAQVLEIVLFNTNLEHIGDIIDRGLLRLAAKKQRDALHFSAEGWADIQAFHTQIADQMRRALTVFVSRDADMARDLGARKDHMRAEKLQATERHFRRLRDGLPETIETSALHLDVLRDLKRINAHLTTVAYPVLEATGELRGSRLRPAAPERTRRDRKRARG